MTGIILSRRSTGPGHGSIGQVPGLLPVAGRYRVIDFVLSNLVAGGISHIGVLCGRDYPALSAYLAGGRDWDLDRRQGGIAYLDPGSEARQPGTVSLQSYLERQSSAYGVLCSCDGMYSLDLGQVLVSHLASGHDLTAVIAGQGSVGPKRVILCILSRDLLLQCLTSGVPLDDWLQSPDQLPAALNGRTITHNLYWYPGPFLEFRTQEELLQNNLSVLEPWIWAQLFGPDRPVFTRPQDGPPAFWGEDSICENSLVSGLCRIEGKLTQSVLSRGVTIGPGARVRQCLLLDGARVGENAELDRVIVGPGVAVPANARLRGRPGHPIQLTKGANHLI